MTDLIIGLHDLRIGHVQREFWGSRGEDYFIVFLWKENDYCCNHWVTHALGMPHVCVSLLVYEFCLFFALRPCVPEWGDVVIFDHTNRWNFFFSEPMRLQERWGKVQREKYSAKYASLYSWHPVDVTLSSQKIQVCYIVTSISFQNMCFALNINRQVLGVLDSGMFCPCVQLYLDGFWQKHGKQLGNRLKRRPTWMFAYLKTWAVHLSDLLDSCTEQFVLSVQYLRLYIYCNNLYMQA